MSRRALVTGVSGQDGSFLAELLVDQGYEVVGVTRPDGGSCDNLAAVRSRVELVSIDLADQRSVASALHEFMPNEIYNLASISFSPASWDDPASAARLGVVGTTSILEAIRSVDPTIRFFQASSSEIFGQPTEAPQRESTPVAPATPYGAAKAYGHFIVQGYRRRHGLFCCSGILYNHESWRRPPTFVTRKISRGAAAISLGLERTLSLGNLDARRDWGFAGDYVRAMWLMLQADEPDDYIVATGRSHSVRDLVQWAFDHVGLDWRDYMVIDGRLKRGVLELHDIVGDPARARSTLRWSCDVPLAEVIARMVDHDLHDLAADAVQGSTLVRKSADSLPT
jgi:GDPmannose 4,6-dehydratase